MYFCILKTTDFKPSMPSHQYRNTHYFRYFLNADWSSSFRAFVDKPNWVQVWWTNQLQASVGLIKFGHAPLNTCGFLAYDLLAISVYLRSFSRLLTGWSVSAHLHTNCWFDSIQSWWANSSLVSPGQSNLWSCATEFPLFPELWLVEQFLCICGKSTDRIQLHFFSWQTYYRPPLAWLIFGYAP